MESHPVSDPLNSAPSQTDETSSEDPVSHPPPFNEISTDHPSSSPTPTVAAPSQTNETSSENPVSDPPPSNEISTDHVSPHPSAPSSAIVAAPTLSSSTPIERDMLPQRAQSLPSLLAAVTTHSTQRTLSFSTPVVTDPPQHIQQSLLPPDATQSLLAASATDRQRPMSSSTPIVTDPPQDTTPQSQLGGSTTTNTPPPNEPLTAPLLTPSRNQAEIEKWRKLVKRCHEVIRILIGFALFFAPLNFVIQTVRRSNDGGDPVAVAIIKLIVSFLQDFQIHLVQPFFIAALTYCTFYIMAATAVHVLAVLWLDMCGVVVGFLTTFLLIYHVLPVLAISAGVVCEGIVIGLFIWQFPRQRVAVNNVGTP